VLPLAVHDMLEVIGATGPLPVEAPLPLGEVELAAPIPHPARNLFCVGKNYREHAAEFAASGYDTATPAGPGDGAYPAVFTKPGTCVVGPYDRVELHASLTQAVDYEAELAVVIGKGGRDIPAERAMAHVFGYTIINDVSARDRQKNHQQWFLGKSLDTFAPMGPWITTADEVNERDLTVSTWVNGELRQHASTADLIFDIPHIIATISAGLTLQPGDIIATGTPAGVGAGFTPPKFLRAGDTVRISIGNLGTISNTFG